MKLENISVSDKFADLYNDCYAGISEWRQICSIDKVDNVMTLCRQHPHATILEIGCGEGSILKRLSDLHFGEALYAIEISRSAVEIVQQRNIPSLIECRLFDGYSIPYNDNAFDLVILSDVIEHVEYPRKILYEAARVATYVFIEVPLEEHIGTRRDFVLDQSGHINFYSSRTIRKLVQTCDLAILAESVTHPSPQTCKFHHGKKGVLRYLMKEIALRIMGEAAANFLTYRSSLLCTRIGMA